MSGDRNGGAAFPSPGVVIDERSYQCHQGAYEGMTLRDYFAAKALPGAASELNRQAVEADRDVAKEDREWAARIAYMWADAMLKAREA